MAQLKMRRESAPVVKRPLPEGYTYEFYKGTKEEIYDWLHLCRATLIPDFADENIEQMVEFFEGSIVNYPDLVPEKDLFFVVSPEGKRVATSAGVVHKNNEGYVHMVAADPSVRGKGIGHVMLSFGLEIIEERGVDFTILTTDDWRLPAIKTYLDAKFVPVIYDEKDEQRERWAEVLKNLNYGDVEYLEED